MYLDLTTDRKRTPGYRLEISFRLCKQKLDEAENISSFEQKSNKWVMASSKMWRAFSLMQSGMHLSCRLFSQSQIFLSSYPVHDRLLFNPSWLESRWSFNTAAYVCIMMWLTSLKFLKGAGCIRPRKAPLRCLQQQTQVSTWGLAKKPWFPMGVSCLVQGNRSFTSLL